MKLERPPRAPAPAANAIEITAIPALLERLLLDGAIVAIG